MNALYQRSHNQTVYVLLRMVVRAFYEDVHVVVMDALLHYQTNQIDEIREGDLVKKVNLQPHVVKKALLDLYNDSIVVKEEKATERKKGQKKYPFKSECFWRIDYEQCINSIRYKLYLVSQEVKKKVQANPTYVCSGCYEEFESYDTAKLLDYSTGLLICNLCGSEVNESADSMEKHEETVSGSDSLEVRFNTQLAPIKDRLDQCKDYVVPKDYRWNYKSIVTKEEADKRIEEQRKQIDRDKSMGTHKQVHVQRHHQHNTLGATAHVAKAAGRSTNSFQLDPSANIIIDFAESNSTAETEKETTPVAKKPENPFFLKQTVSSKEYADYSDVNETVEEEDGGVSLNDREINTEVYHQLLEREHEEQRKANAMDDEFEDNNMIDEFVNVTDGLGQPQQQEAAQDSSETFVYVQGVAVPYSMAKDNPSYLDKMTPQEYENYMSIYKQEEDIYEF
ncbi:hypothetical protein C9374_001620 [Naegleria lovaniensis]|uniref:Transcription initiation factor IIE subunit alpha N-terminal domain-containing protein n=1 Tax=Naegleria lovaniensis TaxID=51637 RepID=A0AA88GVW1_NAELO|nr:uncharacterized protein C9374_001620 [Naegleria lovaniensis]KAG2387288.1 hypothetical protein C9374_001620 [Naegleria lovaniensis]